MWLSSVCPAKWRVSTIYLATTHFSSTRYCFMFSYLSTPFIPHPHTFLPLIFISTNENTHKVPHYMFGDQVCPHLTHPTFPRSRGRYFFKRKSLWPVYRRCLVRISVRTQNILSFPTFSSVSPGKFRDNIVTCMCDYRRGFGLDIDHFSTQLVITLNYSAITDLHTLQITVTLVFSVYN
jgi:hypothetical protein